MITTDMDQTYAKRAFEAAIASLRRSLSKQPNPAITELINKDIALYQKGIDTIKTQK